MFNFNWECEQGEPRRTFDLLDFNILIVGPWWWMEVKGRNLDALVLKIKDG